MKLFFEDYYPDSDILDLRSEVYDALSDIAFKYAGNGFTTKELETAFDDAIEWFQEKFWDVEDLEESLKESRTSNYNDPETGWHKSPEKYKGYSIRLNSKTLALDVYDNHGELESDGFRSFRQAKEYIDDITYNKEDESLKEEKDLSKVEGTITKVLDDNYESLMKIDNVSELRKAVIDLFKENNISTKYSREMINKMNQMKSLYKLQYYLTNVRLAGSGDAVIK